MNRSEEITGWKYPLPEGATGFAAIKMNGSVSTPAVFRGEQIGVSDNKLMGTLSTLGKDPISDRPEICRGRCFWWFDDDADRTIYKMVCAYYAERWNGETGHLSFVRHCIERSRGFANAAKEAVGRSGDRQPLTLRRL